jgi:hypothetical protein
MSWERSMAAIEAAFRRGLQVFRDHWPTLLVLGLAAGALELASLRWGPGFRWSIGLAISVLLAIPLRWGFSYACLRAVRGEAPEPRDLLRPFDAYGRTVIAVALVHAMVLIGFVLLIVPGIYLYCRTRFVRYLMTEQSLDPVEAIRESWRMSELHMLPILGISAAGVALSGVGVLFAGIGVIPASIWWDLALASYFHEEVTTADASLEAGDSVYAE